MANERFQIDSGTNAVPTYKFSSPPDNRIRIRNFGLRAPDKGLGTAGTTGYTIQTCDLLAGFIDLDFLSSNPVSSAANKKSGFFNAIVNLRGDHGSIAKANEHIEWEGDTGSTRLQATTQVVMVIAGSHGAPYINIEDYPGGPGAPKDVCDGTDMPRGALTAGKEYIVIDNADPTFVATKLYIVIDPASLTGTGILKQGIHGPFAKFGNDISAGYIGFLALNTRAWEVLDGDDTDSQLYYSAATYQNRGINLNGGMEVMDFPVTIINT